VTHSVRREPKGDTVMIGSLGWQELLIILVILALLFGASRVADLGGALGKGIREFRSEARGNEDEEEKDQTASSGSGASTTPPDESKSSNT